MIINNIFVKVSTLEESEIFPVAHARCAEAVCAIKARVAESVNPTSAKECYRNRRARPQEFNVSPL